MTTETTPRSRYKPEVGHRVRCQGYEGPFRVVEITTVGETGKQQRATIAPEAGGEVLTGIAVSKLSVYREKEIPTVAGNPFELRVAEPEEDGKVHPAMTAARLIGTDFGHPLMGAEVLEIVRTALRKGTATAHREAAARFLTVHPLVFAPDLTLGQFLSMKFFKGTVFSRSAVDLTKALVLAAECHASEAATIEAQE